MGDVNLTGLPGATVRAWHGSKCEPERQAFKLPQGNEDVGASIVNGNATLTLPDGCEAIAFVLDGSNNLLGTRLVMSGINRDAQVRLLIGPIITAARGVPTNYLTRLLHAGPAIRAKGRIAITGTGLTAAKIAMVQKDFNGPGADLTMAFTDTAPGVVQAEYGPFPLLPDYEGQTTNVVTFDATIAAQSMNALSTMFDLNGQRIGQTNYAFNVTV